MMIPLGGILALIERLRPTWLETEFRHSVMAFGGGVLIAAVSLVLIPEGMKHLSAGVALGAFVAGGLAFAYFEKASNAGDKAQFWAMLTDFVPEALALGAMLAAGAPEAGLLALLIGLQNLPEGFNAFRELAARKGRKTRHRTLFHFVLLGLLGPVAGATGYLLLGDFPEGTAVIMMVAAGGILFLMFQDIAPKAHLANRTAPSIAAVAGFAFGLLGQMLLG
ncbi:MAG: divalent cation transporter [Hyphomicrobiales bacterium]|nr:MAG: divalent cation transporter [Hyphomicrobiales bacterium]